MATYLTFIVLFAALFCLSFSVTFDRIRDLPDAFSATLYVAALGILSLLVAVLSTALLYLLVHFSGACFSAKYASQNISRIDPHSHLEYLIDQQFTHDVQNTMPINMLPSSQIPEPLIDAINRLLHRIKIRFNHHDLRASTKLRLNAEQLSSLQNRDIQRSTLVAELSQQMQQPLKKLIIAIKDAAFETRSEDYAGVRASLLESYRNAIELSELTRSLVSYAGTDIELPANNVAFNFEELMDDCISSTETSQKIAHNVVHRSHMGPATVRADRLRLKFILENLLINSHRFCNNGFVSIVSVISDVNLSVSIRDTGFDIPPSNLENIFDADFNDDANQRDGGASIVLCKLWTESLFGEIHASSEQGKFTTFAINIPVSVMDSRT